MLKPALFITVSALLAAQAVKTPSDFQVHTEFGPITLAADYLVHSLPTAKSTLVAKDYLVVEIAFLGPKRPEVKVMAEQFTLKINGKGNPIGAQLPGMVASSIQFPVNRTNTEASISDGPIGIGTKTPGPRFPGDPTGRPVQGSSKPVDLDNTVDVLVQNASLAEGDKQLPHSGLIYFAYTGKTKNLRTLDLLYEGPLGKATLKLLP